MLDLLLPLGSDESPAGPQVTVGSWNAFVDNDDPDAAARILADDPPDVLVLQELTPETERACAVPRAERATSAASSQRVRAFS